MRLQRLRTHRGVWVLLAFAVFLKIASASACLLDGQGIAMIPGPEGNATHLVAVADAGAVSVDDCMLGEGGGCHCACAHASTLPAPGLVVAAHLAVDSIDIHPPIAPTVRILASPLRPPIA
ncbi:hypothetical protein P3W33_08515 [Luteibacter sp. PPL552]